MFHYFRTHLLGQTPWFQPLSIVPTLFSSSFKPLSPHIREKHHADAGVDASFSGHFKAAFFFFFFSCPRCSLHHSWSLLSILSDFSRIWGPLLSKTLNGVFAVVDGLSHYLRNMPSQDPEDASLLLRLHPKTVCLRLTFGSSFPVVPHRLPTCASHVGCFPVEHTSWYGSLDGPWNIISIFPGILVAWLSWCSGFSELLSNFCTPVIFHSLERVSSLKKKITRFDEEENTLFNYKQRYLSAFTDSFWEYLKCRNMNLSFKDSFPFS